VSDELTPEERAELDAFGSPEPAAILPPDAPKNDANVPAPKKRGRPPGKKLEAAPLIMPDCGVCGAPLNPENSSKLASNAWKHIGCPSEVTMHAPPALPVPTVVVQHVRPTAVHVQEIASTLSYESLPKRLPTLEDEVKAVLIEVFEAALNALRK
jgi:hypothetical protein